MMWYQGEEDEDDDLMCSPAILARRASESWINVPPVEMLSTPQTLQRKKSLPDVGALPRADAGMSREEVSALGSARREEVRRMHEETEKLRANPLLYLVSPQVKDWFSRQQLVILVLFINISLGIMFFKLLT
nr:junctophilin [Papilio xuthus]